METFSGADQMTIATKLSLALLMCSCFQLAPAYGSDSDDTPRSLPPFSVYEGDFDPPGGIDYRYLLHQPAPITVPRLMPNSPSAEQQSILNVMKEHSRSDTVEGRKATPKVTTPTNDPDTSKELKTVWELWRERVSKTINARFNDVAERSFSHYLKPISCEVTYSISNDRRIFNIHMVRKSDSLVFNSMLFMVLNSMHGNAVLDFPAGSKRESIEMNGTFSRNADKPGGVRFLNESADTEKKR